jgi:hypothetical protein
MTGDHTFQITALIPAGVVGADIGCCLVAGAVHEDDFGSGARHLERGLHEAKGGREDQFAAVFHKIAHNALCVWAFCYVFYVFGADFGAEGSDQFLARQLMLIGPAAFSNRVGIEKTDFEWLGGRGAAQAQHKERRCAACRKTGKCGRSVRVAHVVAVHGHASLVLVVGNAML